ncbi:MAG: bifunctional adenosylcobinamide kinase/adenosylcobinamide-phosphate guanylyltransferase [Anaerovoracaceae bacterium]|jgi:adenosylcobinamide kinase/adenosylcobinamide-phosphate guanylyltransferase
MNIFISGGCKNGKSYFAQHLAKQQAAAGGPLYYIATMQPVDEEDDARIIRHQEEREGWGFKTIEQSRNISQIQADFSGSFLFDSVTALLSNEMFPSAEEVVKDAYLSIAKDVVDFARKTGNTVFVSDYIYSDAMKYDELTECYRRGLAYIDKALAKECQVVIDVSYGHINYLKGELPR